MLKGWQIVILVFLLTLAIILTVYWSPYWMVISCLEVRQAKLARPSST